MSWLSDQIQKSIRPTLNTINQAAEQTHALVSGYIGGITAGASGQKADNKAMGLPYTSAGSTAMNAYMDALGLPYLISSRNTDSGVVNGQIDFRAGNLSDMIGSPQTGFRTQAQWNALGQSTDDMMYQMTGQKYAPNTENTGAAVYSTPSSTESILSRFTTSPGYQAMLQQGLGSVNAKASSAGLLGSGAQLKALTRYAGDYAQAGYQKYLGNLLASAQLGQDTTKSIGANNSSIENATIGATATLGAADMNLQGQLAETKAKYQNDNRELLPGQFGSGYGLMNGQMMRG